MRVCYQYKLCILRYRLLKRIPVKVPAAIFQMHRCCLYAGACEFYAVHVLGEVRFEHENLVARPYQVSDCTIDRSEGPVGDKDLRVRVEIVASVSILHQGREEFRNTLSEEGMARKHGVLIVGVVPERLFHVL